MAYFKSKCRRALKEWATKTDQKIIEIQNTTDEILRILEGSQSPTHRRPWQPEQPMASVYFKDKIYLTWYGVIDPNAYIDRYEIYRDGALIDSVSDCNEYYDVGVSAGRDHRYFIVAVDEDGNYSNPSETSIGRARDGA